MISASAIMLLTSLWWTGVTGLLILTVTYKLYMAKRKNRKAEACEGCDELAEGGVCSGFELQAEKLRELEIVLTENLEKEIGIW